MIRLAVYFNGGNSEQIQVLKLVIHIGKFNIEKESNKSCDTDMQKNSHYDYYMLRGNLILGVKGTVNLQ